MRTLLVGSVSALALAACASSGKSAAAPVEVLSTGTPGEAAATRVQKLSATVRSVDRAARTVVVEDEGGAAETIKVPAEVRRFDEIAVGDVVRVELEQGLLLQYQPPGAADVAPKVVVAAGRETGAGAPGASAAAGVQATVTIGAIDLEKRLVELRAPSGRTFQVKAGPKLRIERLKAGDRLLATYLEATAVQLEKAAR